MRIAAALLTIGLIAAAPVPEKQAARPSTTKFVPRKLFDEPPPAAASADPKPAGGQKAVWDVTKVSPDAVDIPKSIYFVQPGDTLLAIMRKTGGSANVIAHDNDLEPPFRLRPGQKLKIAAGRYHTVRKGQSGIAIARAYGVEWLRIVDLNHLEEPYALREGERLLLPPAKEVAGMTLEQRAAAFKIDLTDIATGGEPALAPQARPAAPTASPRRTLPATTPVAEPAVDFGGRFAWPVQGKVIRRYGPMDNGGRSDGIAIAAPFGRPIGAAADGIVIWVGQHPAFGNVVLLRHGNGWVTIYGNADRLLVKRGQSVKIGQAIAQVGLSGSGVDRPQTFFEVLRGRKPVNPMSLLPKQREGGDDARSDTSRADTDANDN
ncbi:peptidoglycan DD-metalloendopeptidase family protein [Sphingomonas sp. ASY06-1R]|jgi:murein DD-endopeptidase MepM/ murein hydrolase activator NlpD|uniref:peptidoglycan DD-metalloendopeptidase family protein n=1 Tax=Sphingomonas sp. ASY06-1R TaxID=3445771 RepID=UPI003FA2B784